MAFLLGRTRPQGGPVRTAVAEFIDVQQMMAYTAGKHLMYQAQVTETGGRHG